MRILGIDPGYATIGFGLIEGERAQFHMVTYGAITTPAGLPLSKRLYQIGRHRLRQGGEAAGHGYDQTAFETGENAAAG